MNISTASQNITAGPIIWPYVQPPIFQSFWFEKFDVVKHMTWLEKNWTLSLYISAVYILLIFAGQKFMTKRQPYNLRGPLAIWNLAITLFSIIGFTRSLPELLFVIGGNNGFYRSVCVRDSHNEPGAFWAWMFTLSKVVELGDTAFIVLRKRPLYFVHYFHHGFTLIMCWYFYSFYEPIYRYFGLCNGFCHFILYGYMFLKTIGIKMPKVFVKIVMSVEILQLIVGVVLNSYASWVKAQGQPCEHRTDVIIFQIIMYLLFVAVFGYHFMVTRKQDQNKKKKSF